MVTISGLALTGYVVVVVVVNLQSAGTITTTINTRPFPVSLTNPLFVSPPWKQDLGFSPSDRAESVRRVGELSCLFNDAGTVTIVSLVSPYRGDRDLVRYDDHDYYCYYYYPYPPLQGEQMRTKGLVEWILLPLLMHDI